jgi:RNA polymerase sigma-70 factor (ECF subfamily)
MFTGMPVFSSSYEKILLDKILAGDTSSFSVVFSHYYKDLVTFSFSFTKDTDAAEEIVQDVFVRFWENRTSLTVEKSLKSYLLKSVQNRSLNWLHHRRVQSHYAAWVTDHPVLFENETEQYVLHSELESKLHHALAQLPPDAADAFRLHRMENMTYPEIAQKLGVSVRTVEVRISRALSLLREALRDFLGLIIMLFIQRF